MGGGGGGKHSSWLCAHCAGPCRACDWWDDRVGRADSLQALQMTRRTQRLLLDVQWKGRVGIRSVFRLCGMELSDSMRSIREKRT